MYTYDHRKEKTLEGKLDKFIDNATTYFTKITDKENYRYVNIMEYVNDSYVLTNKISDYNLSEMRKNMDENDQEEFDKFVEENWGVQLNKEEAIPVGAGVSAQPKKRGRKPKNTNI